MMNKIQKAVGETIVRLDKEAKADYNLICLDNNQTNKYNYENNGFMWHKAHPLSGAKFSRRGLSPTATPTAIISDFSFRILKNTIKSLFLPILAIMLSLNLAYADDPQPTQAKESELEKLEKEIFVNSNDFLVEKACEPSCRAVSDSYIALIKDFNPSSGLTSCSIYQKDLDYNNPIAFNANTLHTYCRENLNNKIIQINKKYLNYKPTNPINFTSNSENALKNKITLGNFISGLFTLDPKFISIENTKNNGILKYNDEIGDIIKNSGDFLDMENLAVFVNGFSSIEKLYRKLLNWLLVFIGAYFLFTIFADMVNSKLEKKDYHFKVLNGFLIPVVAFAVFFMPIQQSDNMHSTIFQKLTRYFVQEGIKVADLATLHFQNAYLSSLFQSLNSSLTERKRNAEVLIDTSSIERDYVRFAYNRCLNAFAPIKSFQISSDREMQLKTKNFIEKQTTKNQIFSFEACKSIENKLLILNQNIRDAKMEFDGYENNINTILDNLKNYNELINKNIVDKGWISMLSAPSTQIFISMFLEQEYDLSNINNTVSISDEKEKNQSDTSEEMHFMSVPSSLTGKLAYLVLPGATGIFNHAMEFGGAYTLNKTVHKMKRLGINEKSTNMLKGMATKIFTKLDKVPFAGVIFDTVSQGFKIVMALKLVETLYNMILENLPILTASVAAVIAFLSYIVMLFKFFYVSPVMLMYAVTSKRKDKINDFLVTGITVFLKPLLIVVFLFLAIIFYNILINLFDLQTMEQFLLMTGVAGENYGGIGNDMIMSVIFVLMKILSSIAAMYIMFQLIYYGPDRLLKLIGVNNGDDGLISGLHGSVSKHMTGGL